LSSTCIQVWKMGDIVAARGSVRQVLLAYNRKKVAAKCKTKSLRPRYICSSPECCDQWRSDNDERDDSCMMKETTAAVSYEVECTQVRRVTPEPQEQQKKRGISRLQWPKLWIARQMILTLLMAGVWSNGEWRWGRTRKPWWQLDVKTARLHRAMTSQRGKEQRTWLIN